jgi:hypothetical protein
MDLLGYSTTKLDMCLKDKSRREINDILRQVFLRPERIRICPCVKEPWIRKTLEFLNAEISNEPSHQS